MADLTRRQLQVLQGLADGMSRPQMAREWHMSESTVRTHVEEMRSRLAARTAAHAVAIGYQRGILRMPESEEVQRQTGTRPAAEAIQRWHNREPRVEHDPYDSSKGGVAL